jgi:hypothetical protein
VSVSWWIESLELISTELKGWKEEPRSWSSTEHLPPTHD